MTSVKGIIVLEGADGVTPFGVIYALVRTDSSKKYIGCTTNVVKRVYGHQKAANNNVTTAIAGAIRKHGASKFNFQVIVCAIYLKSNLQLLEKQIISQEKTLVPGGYNLTEGGDGVVNASPCVGRKISKALRGRKTGPFSVERRLHLSRVMKGKVPKASVLRASAEARRKNGVKVRDRAGTNKKISAALTGQKWTEERRANHKRAVRLIAGPKITVALTGKKLSIAHRRTLSKAHTGLKWSPAQREAQAGYLWWTTLNGEQYRAREARTASDVRGRR